MKHSPYHRKQKTLNANMNVVPYIDVMLVLLVIFMVATPMMTTGVDVNLPQEQTQTIGTSTQLPVVVSLDNNGNIALSYDQVKNQPLDINQLTDTLKQLQTANQNDGIQVMVNADQSNEYGKIMRLMATIQLAGVKKVGLLTGAPTNE